MGVFSLVPFTATVDALRVFRENTAALYRVLSTEVTFKSLLHLIIKLIADRLY